MHIQSNKNKIEKKKKPHLVNRVDENDLFIAKQTNDTYVMHHETSLKVQMRSNITRGRTCSPDNVVMIK